MDGPGANGKRNLFHFSDFKSPSWNQASMLRESMAEHGGITWIANGKVFRETDGSITGTVVFLTEGEPSGESEELQSHAW
jgi:hypothetical protein